MVSRLSDDEEERLAEDRRAFLMALAQAMDEGFRHILEEVEALEPYGGEVPALARVTDELRHQVEMTITDWWRLREVLRR